jgi:RNA polymerase sigma-70 factor (ECF subfamily)
LQKAKGKSLCGSKAIFFRILKQPKSTEGKIKRKNKCRPFAICLLIYFFPSRNFFLPAGNKQTERQHNQLTQQAKERHLDLVSEPTEYFVFSSETLATTMTDGNLLQAAALGDETAFRLLYERHREVVFRFAYRMLQSIELAEEITHDCFLSLIKKPTRFDASRASLKTYLCAAARNQALKHLQRAMTYDELSPELPTSEQLNPLKQVIGAELAAVVRAAIAVLPPLQREALILFEYEDLSLAEVALIVNADVGTVKARLHRGREKLRQLLTPYINDGTRTAAP